MSANETIHVSETGGQKAGNLERYDLIPTGPLRSLAALYGKEEDSAPSFCDLHSHLVAFWGGEDIDPVSGVPHIIHVAWNAFELVNDPPNKYSQLQDAYPLLERFDAIPGEPLRLLAQHYGVGAKKYDDDNWRRGYKWGLSYAALSRHLWQFWTGEDVDAETGSPHLIAVAWHAFTLAWFMVHRRGFDTRPKPFDTKALAFNTLDKSGFQPLGRISSDGLKLPTQQSYSVTLPMASVTLADGLLEVLAKPIFEDTLLASPAKPPTVDTVSPYLDRIPTGDPLEIATVYISGPMSGMPDHNFPAFNKAAAEWRANGYSVINPAELPGEDLDKPWAWYLRRDIAELVKATHIVLLPGWRSSKGATLEHDIAERLGMTIVHPEPRVVPLLTEELAADGTIWRDADGDDVKFEDGTWWRRWGAETEAEEPDDEAHPPGRWHQRSPRYSTDVANEFGPFTEVCE